MRHFRFYAVFLNSMECNELQKIRESQNNGATIAFEGGVLSDKRWPALVA